jgi:cysteine synthase A
MWHKQVENVYLNQAPVTPLVPVRSEPEGPVVWCKLEFLNPSGSTKDRIAGYILGKALRQERLEVGQTVIEASSGSTSIAMALACAQFGLRFVAVMPEGVSPERVMIIQAYGGEVIFTPRAEGIQGSISRAEALAEERSAFLPRQFSNPDNAEAHRRQTAQEIMGQIPSGRVDAVVSGVGTGGTLVGLLEGFQDFGCDTRPFYARPVHGTALKDAECCSFSQCIPGVVEGLSDIFRNADLSRLSTIEVDDGEAMEAARYLMRLGFPVGASSGLNYLAALDAAAQLERGATVVTVFPDRMERYFSTELFHPQV